jgi:hypothetical protein
MAKPCDGEQGLDNTNAVLMRACTAMCGSDAHAMHASVHSAIIFYLAWANDNPGNDIHDILYVLIEMQKKPQNAPRPVADKLHVLTTLAHHASCTPSAGATAAGGACRCDTITARPLSSHP